MHIKNKNATDYTDFHKLQGFLICVIRGVFICLGEET
jgi:hypothetical protein